MPRWIRELSQWQALLAAFIGLVAAVVTVVGAVWAAHAKVASAEASGTSATVPSTSSTTSTSSVATTTTSPPDTSTTYTTTTFSTAPTTDAAQGAQVGDCFDNNGTAQVADLVATACQQGTFKVVQVLQGTTDTSGCDGVADDSWNVPSAADDLVLCLSYQPRGGTGYYAGQGTCVYGTATSGVPWNQVACQGGNFTVLARYTGTTDASLCASLSGYDMNELFTPPNRSDLDVVLCLSMNYPQGAIGRAQVGACLYPSGPRGHLVFTAAACNPGNVQVVWRTGVYDDVSNCGSYGWATWNLPGFPSLSYTVCYQLL